MDQFACVFLWCGELLLLLSTFAHLGLISTLLHCDIIFSIFMRHNYEFIGATSQV